VCGLVLRHRERDVVDRRSTEADHFEVAGAAKLIRSIHIHHTDGAIQWVKRILRIVAGPEQTFLFGRHGEKQNTTLRLLRRRQSFHCSREFE
jgi:hypothetical protein